MDTSETYIKMCERAEEIQKHIFDPEDTTKCICGGLETLGSFHLFYDVFALKPTHTVWLPRQDQLQEMIPLIVEGQTGYPEVSAAVLNKFLTFQWNGFYKSMEQLWLAFVMKEKCNKIWDGEAWIVGRW